MPGVWPTADDRVLPVSAPEGLAASWNTGMVLTDSHQRQERNEVLGQRVVERTAGEASVDRALSWGSWGRTWLVLGTGGTE